MANRLDILIFGATGFTGIRCIPYIYKLSKENGRNLSWGVAGRSEKKLKNALKEMEDKLEQKFDSIPIIIADVNNCESLVNMARKAKLIINCCGPYLFLGDAVRACIDAGTHHIDITAEPEFMERLKLEKHEAAQEKGVYVINACGVDSIPTDLGVIHLQQNFEGTLNSVETFLKVTPGGKGSNINYGTWESGVHSVSNIFSLIKTRRHFTNKFKKTPTFVPKVQQRLLPFKVDEGWALPFLSYDGPIARRSQGYIYKNENVRPAQVATYVVVPSILIVIRVLWYVIVFATLTRFAYGKKLLLNYPQLFSAGFITKEHPSEEVIQNSWISIDFYGKGWKEKLLNGDNQYTVPVNRFVKTQIKACNGYAMTCLAAVLAGIVVLTETDMLANKGKGGVYSPGAAFAKTSLLKQLSENGLTFEILSCEDIKKNT